MYIPNYFDYTHGVIVGEYLHDLLEFGLNLQWIDTRTVNEATQAQVLYKFSRRGYPSTLFGLPNKAYTVWSYYPPEDSVMLIYMHDNSYAWYSCNRRDLIAAVDLKYGDCATFRADVDKLCEMVRNIP